MPTIKKRIHRPWQIKPKPQEGRKYANTKFYQSTEWRKLRALKLELNPLCEICGVVPARVADHRVPINRGGAPLDISNLQSLCSSCHNRKSAQKQHGHYKHPLTSEQAAMLMNSIDTSRITGSVTN